jgi:hypothetical protein
MVKWDAPNLFIDLKQTFEKALSAVNNGGASWHRRCVEVFACKFPEFRQIDVNRVFNMGLVVATAKALSIIDKFLAFVLERKTDLMEVLEGPLDGGTDQIILGWLLQAEAISVGEIPGSWNYSFEADEGENRTFDSGCNVAHFNHCRKNAMVAAWNRLHPFYGDIG